MAPKKGMRFRVEDHPLGPIFIEVFAEHIEITMVDHDVTFPVPLTETALAGFASDLEIELSETKH